MGKNKEHDRDIRLARTQTSAIETAHLALSDNVNLSQKSK